MQTTIQIDGSKITVMQGAAEPKLILPAVSGRSMLDILRKPAMVKLAANGERLPDTATNHVAVLLPEFGLEIEAGYREANNWAEAVKLGRECPLFDGKGWQLWGDVEASLTIDRSRTDPATYVGYFPNTPTNRIWWTRTPLASSPSGLAVCVGFDGGGVGWGGQGHFGFVRACRLVPSSQ